MTSDAEVVLCVEVDASDILENACSSLIRFEEIEFGVKDWAFLSSLRIL